jgi:hypothetical protein
LSIRQETGFADLCEDTRSGFRNAVDLVLIHNEKDVRGNQPRAVLNDLTIVLAVAAWERFVVDVQALGTRKWTGPGHHRKTDGIAYLGHPSDPAKPGPARMILDHASGGRLPADWTVVSFWDWRGKSPRSLRKLDGGTEMAQLAEQADAWIRLRNSVMHRCMAQDLKDPYWKSDADSHTIQAGWARAVLALFLQLTDQAIAAIAAEAGFPQPDVYRLPEEWFLSEAPAGLRGVREPNVLWGGHALAYALLAQGPRIHTPPTRHDVLPAGVAAPAR